MSRTETGIEGNLPTWKGASAVYSHAYRYMAKYGADDSLIEFLDEGNEESIKAHLLRLNADMLDKRNAS